MTFNKIKKDKLVSIKTRLVIKNIVKDKMNTKEQSKFPLILIWVVYSKYDLLDKFNEDNTTIKKFYFSKKVYTKSKLLDYIIETLNIGFNDIDF